MQRVLYNFAAFLVVLSCVAGCLDWSQTAHAAPIYGPKIVAPEREVTFSAN